MDQLYPMMYFRGNQFFPFALDWQEQAAGRTIAPGLAVYMLSPKEGNWSFETLQRELDFLRANGMGHTFFRAKFLNDNWKGIYNYVSNQLNRYPALVPPMTWMSSSKPARPTNLKVNRNGKIVTLSWQGATETYNVYASDTYPVNTSDPRNLIAVRLRSNSVSMESPRMAHAFFAVCASDRYGNESEPAEERTATEGAGIVSPQGLLQCDGQRLVLPQKPAILDAQLVVIETMQGSVIATRRWTGNSVSVANIPEGFYRLRSLARVRRKTVTHNLGVFMVKRKSTRMR